GDAPDGLPTYIRLRDDALAALENIGARLALTNGIGLLQAVRDHALILDESSARRSTQPSAAPAARPAPRLPPPSIERPSLILASPRSGSSMLFEPLGRSPDLYTVGGESHLVIEGIPELRPSRRGWDSNRLDAGDATPRTVAELRRRFVPEL